VSAFLSRIEGTLEGLGRVFERGAEAGVALGSAVGRVREQIRGPQLPPRTQEQRLLDQYYRDLRRGTVPGYALPGMTPVTEPAPGAVAEQSQMALLGGAALLLLAVFAGGGLS
jgi:hypothetical protein